MRGTLGPSWPLPPYTLQNNTLGNSECGRTRHTEEDNHPSWTTLQKLFPRRSALSQPGQGMDEKTGLRGKTYRGEGGQKLLCGRGGVLRGPVPWIERVHRFACTFICHNPLHRVLGSASSLHLLMKHFLPADSMLDLCMRMKFISKTARRANPSPNLVAQQHVHVGTWPVWKVVGHADTWNQIVAKLDVLRLNMWKHRIGPSTPSLLFKQPISLARTAM